MAVPFRRTSKTAKRKRRTHFKLKKPTLVVCSETDNFTLPHRITRNSAYYNGKLFLTSKKKETTKDN
ncbi:50S ribosomal protein L32 [Candidatus Phytoplasma pini]|uniref:Large ribosomal subunit protein bL32 n=1 Tax=Candidatus Phytoplasma pini TaxID=267362 RepID=A0A559KJ86_9MOLU|nr:50S ribosomal protein L32 [Candidatus Phytoplasma pini]TVY12194.1 ribosomal protein L32 [Candidatus Phytoplasma pini]